jgi:Tfp pilus assembly protein PilF
LRRLRADLAANPGDPVRAIALARHHFAIAQESGDPRHIGYAEAALSGIAEDGATRAELFIVRAQLAQYLHDFPKALSLLERALAIEPEDPEALAWKIAVHMVQADYAAARRDCERLARVVSELLGAGCGAQVAAATGALQPAYARLQRTLAAHPEARPSLRQWVSVLLADMAQRLGDGRAADTHYRAAFAADAPDQYLLAAYAEFLIDERRPAEAAALLRGQERSDALLLQMARAAKALGSADTPRLAEILRARYAEAALRGSRLHAQDEARYRLEFLGDPAGALALAQQNWADQQREASDARILLEAALAAKSPEAARPVLDWLAASRFEDARLRAAADGLRALKP